MRNAILFLLMALAYAFASERDYQDAELLNTQAGAISVDRACLTAPAVCDVEPGWKLAQNR